MKRIAVLMVLLIFLAACSNEDTEEETTERETPVEVEQVQTEDFVINREVIGRTTTSDTTPVISETPGELVTLNVSKGDRIEEGQQIGVVDPGDGESQVELQQIAVRQAEKQLENAQISKEQAESGLENAQDQLELAEEAEDAQDSQNEQAKEMAQQQYEQAQGLADQTKSLFEEGIIPEVLHQQAQSRADQAQAQLQQLQGGAQQSSSGVAQAEAQVDQARQQLEQARIAVDQAELQVEQANVQLNQTQDQTSNQIITAPATGEIASLEATEGALVTNQQPFATIVGLNPMTVTASITAEQLSLFNNGDEVEVEISTFDEKVTSTVESVSSVPDDTGLYPVEATVDNDEENIKPGMMATFLLPETVVENSLVVPTDAVMEEGNESYIYHVVDGEAVRVNVEVVEAQTDRTAINAELPEDAQVITTGQLTLTDGGKVTIMEEDEQSEAS
ncbi:efflux RND transporter periplasmic adaptor subunit [Halobacillus sp. K22]|uniref:efflux RND transporter periplasmic adaptor subunit n=1 Tax=Halobacillus sp. K22 TaxID=3457431 RepID=UPI003FCC4B62